MEIGLSFGSNLGDRLEHFRRARESLSHIDGVSIAASSGVYETEPVDVAPEYLGDAFLNAVVVIETTLAPHVVRAELATLEAEFGRRRGADRNAPRTIDLDILYVDALRIETPDLTVPHPRWQERRFVVAPLADVRPALVLPGDARSVAEILLALPESPKVVLLTREW